MQPVFLSKYKVRVIDPDEAVSSSDYMLGVKLVRSAVMILPCFSSWADFFQLVVAGCCSWLPVVWSLNYLAQACSSGPGIGSSDATGGPSMVSCSCPFKLLIRSGSFNVNSLRCRPMQPMCPHDATLMGSQSINSLFLNGP